MHLIRKTKQRYLVSLTPEELTSISNALNEVCNGVHHWLCEQDRVVAAYVCYSRAYRGEHPIGWHLAPVLIAGAFLARWYAKTKRPMIVLTAGMFFFFAFVVFWRSCHPAPEHHHPYMREGH